MRTHQLETITISQNALDWLKEKYTAVDKMSITDYSKFLAEDCQLQFGNNPIAQGRDNLLNGIAIFWKNIQGLDHSFINVLGTDNLFAAEAIIDYTTSKGKLVPLPCTTLIKRNEAGQASSIKIFIDTTPLFS